MCIIYNYHIQIQIRMKNIMKIMNILITDYEFEFRMSAILKGKLRDLR